MMKPVQRDCSCLKASGSRCTKAVERMTPVPKCLPRKKTIGGMRRNLARFERAGNETAAGACEADLGERACAEKTYRRARAGILPG